VRMMLRVEQGKGHKDRYTVLSSRALSLLEELWRRERPEVYFFSLKRPARSRAAPRRQTA
ncbi:MAG: hypothetical protein PHV28_19370, partial [Kiritimatiellae bacterium]|nr:hypothetical protein [Kiritimatiellia bacterium]